MIDVPKCSCGVLMKIKHEGKDKNGNVFYIFYCANMNCKNKELIQVYKI